MQTYPELLLHPAAQPLTRTLTVTVGDRDVLVDVRWHPLADTGPAPTPCMDEGRIIVPRTQGDIDATVARWKALGAQPMAHDVETAASPTVPNGSGLHPHLGTMRLAQFGVRDGGDGVAEALVIDTWKFAPGELLGLLGDRAWPTIIHYAQMEAKWLGYKYGVRIENLIDTRHAAKLIYDRHGFTAPPIHEDLVRLAGDAERVNAAIEQGADKLPAVKGPRFALGVVSQRDLGIVLDKTQQNSYWDAVKLTPAQLKYAGEDVLSLLDLHARQEPLLTAEDRQAMFETARTLVDKAAGVNEQEAARRIALAESGEPEHSADEDISKVKAFTPAAKGCESERAIRMVQSCRTRAELDKVTKALPYLRLHFTNTDAVQAAVRKRARQLARGTKPARAAKVKVAGWEQPF